MKNKVSKEVFKHAALSLMTLAFLSSSALGLVETGVKRDVSTQLPSQQMIMKVADVSVAQKKVTAKGRDLTKQSPAQKSSQATASSDVKSLVSRFEDWATKSFNMIKTTILPKQGSKAQPHTAKQQPSVVKVNPSMSLTPLPKAIQPLKPEKKTSIITAKPVASPIKKITPKTAETMASLLISKPIVTEVTEAVISPPPSPPITVFTSIPGPAEVQNASDAVDELATTINETAKINDEISDNEQKIDKLMAHTKALEEEALLGAEKQNALLSNLKAPQTEPGNRESFLESIRNPHALRKVIPQPKAEVAETLLGTLQRALMDRRVVYEEEESTDEPILTVGEGSRLTSVKKTVDEIVIDNLAAIEAAQKKIAILTPAADLPLETGFTKQIQQQNRARSQAIKEIKELNDQIIAYSKNNETLLSQKAVREEEIASRQQKVLSKLKAKTEQPVSRESFLESIRNRAKNPAEEPTEMTVNIPSKQEVRSGGMKSLQEKIQEAQKFQELKHRNLPPMSPSTDEDWDD